MKIYYYSDLTQVILLLSQCLFHQEKVQTNITILVFTVIGSALASIIVQADFGEQPSLNAPVNTFKSSLVSARLDTSSLLDSPLTGSYPASCLTLIASKFLQSNADELTVNYHKNVAFADTSLVVPDQAPLEWESYINPLCNIKNVSRRLQWLILYKAS